MKPADVARLVASAGSIGRANRMLRSRKRQAVLKRARMAMAAAKAKRAGRLKAAVAKTLEMIDGRERAPGSGVGQGSSPKAKTRRARR